MQVLSPREERINKIVALVTEEDYTLQEVGETFHISRERVRQILVRAKIEYRAGLQVHIDNKLRTCPICNKKYVYKLHTKSQRREARKRKLLGIIEHCRKYKHPNPNTSNWQLTQKIVKEYKKGKSASYLEKKYNLAHQETLYIYLKQWHVEPRYAGGALYKTWVEQPVGRNIERQKEVAIATKTKTHRQVALEYGISPSRVEQLVKKFAHEELT